VSSAADTIVEIRGLTKVYPGKVPVAAVKGIDLDVHRGELFGLLGPNGAGKTTTISICTTRALPTSGKVTIAGINVVAHPAAARRHMGVVTQFNTLDRQCTVFENVYYHCRYFGMSHAQSAAKARELIELFKLTEREKSNVAQLSGGLAQRVQIARAIAHEPQVLFLDEPSAHHRGAGDVSWLRVLPLGNDAHGALAADSGADQSGGLHERGPAYHANAVAAAHAGMGDVDRAGSQPGSLELGGREGLSAASVELRPPPPFPNRLVAPVLDWGRSRNAALDCPPNFLWIQCNYDANRTDPDRQLARNPHSQAAD
jgi:ABC-type Na+ transport system ATPase subunit NatA